MSFMRSSCSELWLMLALLRLEPVRLWVTPGRSLGSPLSLRPPGVVEPTVRGLWLRDELLEVVRGGSERFPRRSLGDMLLTLPADSSSVNTKISFLFFVASINTQKFEFFLNLLSPWSKVRCSSLEDIKINIIPGKIVRK